MPPRLLAVQIRSLLSILGLWQHPHRGISATTSFQSAFIAGAADGAIEGFARSFDSRSIHLKKTHKKHESPGERMDASAMFDLRHGTCSQKARIGVVRRRIVPQ